MITLIIVIVAALVGLGSAWYGDKDDMPTEQAMEAIIEGELDLPSGAVDLTPDSKEKS